MVLSSWASLRMETNSADSILWQPYPSFPHRKLFQRLDVRPFWTTRTLLMKKIPVQKTSGSKTYVMLVTLPGQNPSWVIITGLDVGRSFWQWRQRYKTWFISNRPRKRNEDSQILITKSVFCLGYKHGNKTKYMLTFNNMYFSMSVSGVVSFT